MARYIDADELIEDLWGRYNNIVITAAEIETIINNVPTASVVHKELFDQVRWERDEAIKTLEAHGFGNMER